MCHLSSLSAGFQSQTAFFLGSGGRIERNNRLDKTLQQPNQDLLINDLFQGRLSFIGVINIFKISVFYNKTGSVSQSHYMITMDSGERAETLLIAFTKGPRMTESRRYGNSHISTHAHISLTRTSFLCPCLT